VGSSIRDAPMVSCQTLNQWAASVEVMKGHERADDDRDPH
jgi:hypothetical protein